MRNFTSTIILLLILMALGSFYFIYLKNQPDRNAIINSNQEIKLVEENDLQKVLIKEISSKSQDSKWHLKKEGENWKIDDETASAEKVDDYIDKIYSLGSSSLINDSNDQEFGFDLPQLEITLQSINKESHLFFGNETPTKDKIYAKNKQIITIDKSIFAQLKKNKNDFQ